MHISGQIKVLMQGLDALEEATMHIPSSVVIKLAKSGLHSDVMHTKVIK
jgi:hypothetical protein